MAESSSGNQAIDETGEGHVTTPGDMPATLLPVAHDANGVPVVDLREAPGKDGAFIVVDGELVIRLADGTEWPVSTNGDRAEIVLQLADQAFVSAGAVEAALESFDTALPVAELAETAVREPGAFPASAVETVATPQAEGPANAADSAAEEESVEPVSGGAAFRTFELGSIGQSLSPTMELDPTDRGQGDGASGSGTPPDARLTASGSIAINFAPDAGNDSATTSERQSVEIDVLGNDRDPNKNDDIALVGVDTTGLAGQVTANPDGSLSYDPNGQFTHLGEGETATERFTYTVVDSQGATDTATVEVTVTGVNDTPIAVDDTVTTDERTIVALDLLSNDSDPDTNDTLALAAVDTTNLVGIVGLLPDGSLAYSPNGAFTHLGLGEQAIDTFLYAVADQHGAFDVAEVTVLIEGVNDAPIATDDLVVVSEDGEVRFDALANDIDPDTNDTLRVVSLQSLGNSQGQRWINHDGTITYRPFGAYEYLGEGEIAYQEFGYTVADQHGAIDTGVVTVAIVGANDAPVAVDAAVQSKLLGAEEVTIVYRRGQERMSASAHEQEHAATTGVRIVCNAAPVRLSGDGRVETAVFAYTRANGAGIMITDETFELRADQVFLAIGQTLGGLPEGLAPQGGKIAVSAAGRTGLPGVWAGGDCTPDGEDLTVTAVAQGRDAAMDIHAQLTAA